MAKSKTRAPKISVLDTVEKQGREILAVRNLSRTTQIIPSGVRDVPDLALGVFEETLVYFEAWKNNRSLREREKSGDMLLQLVTNAYAPRPLPDFEKAPPDARIEKHYDRAHALHIVLQQDLAAALESINEKIVLDGGRQNIKVQKERFVPILRFVEYAEPLVQNRKSVISAVKARLGQIRAL